MSIVDIKEIITSCIKNGDAYVENEGNITMDLASLELSSYNAAKKIAKKIPDETKLPDTYALKHDKFYIFTTENNEVVTFYKLSDDTELWRLKDDEFLTTKGFIKKYSNIGEIR